MWFTFSRSLEDSWGLAMTRRMLVKTSCKNDGMRGLSMKIANRLAGTMAGMFVLFASVTAWAAAGQPEPWQIGLQDGVTPVAEFIESLHNFLLWIITAITLFVLGLMLYVFIRFNAKTNPVPSKTTHNTFIEVAWTV